MKIKYNGEIIVGFIFTLVAAILLLKIPTEIKTLETTAINAQTVPKIALGGLGIFSFLLFLQGLLLLPKKEVVFGGDLYASKEFKDTIRSFIYIGILVVYAILFKVVGFIVSSIYLIFAVLIYYGAKKKSYYIIALIISALVYLVFAKVLNISLP
ncbi:MAG: tripartite tricarboxylate transporter TctB family protein [Sphaerochaetaceae bacterium]|jgi:putative tricarboxylic transport membrane protein